MGLNLTEEAQIFDNRSHPSMIQINTIAYILEILFYTLTLVFAPAYIFLSKFARRFHPLLRFQLRLFYIEILVLSVTRLVGVILRLVEAAVYTLPEPWKTLKDLFTVINLGTVNQVDFSVFLIAMERLLATYKINSYEKSYHSPILRIGILIYVFGLPNAINYYAFTTVTENVLQSLGLLSILNFATTVTYVVGIIAMETSRILSNRQLKSKDRELSTSFQCKENLMVVRMIRPVFILLFLTRIVQFFSKWFMYAVNVQMGAVIVRIAAHLYNQSVAVCFLLVPLLMLKNHANLTRFTKQTDVVNEVDGDVYFQTLMDKWN